MGKGVLEAGKSSQCVQQPVFQQTTKISREVTANVTDTSHTYFL